MLTKLVLWPRDPSLFGGSARERARGAMLESGGLFCTLRKFGRATEQLLKKKSNYSLFWSLVYCFFESCSVAPLILSMYRGSFLPLVMHVSDELRNFPCFPDFLLFVFSPAICRPSPSHYDCNFQRVIFFTGAGARCLSAGLP